MSWFPRVAFAGEPAHGKWFIFDRYEGYNSKIAYLVVFFDPSLSRYTCQMGANFDFSTSVSYTAWTGKILKVRISFYVAFGRSFIDFGPVVWEPSSMSWHIDGVEVDFRVLMSNQTLMILLSNQRWQNFWPRFIKTIAKLGNLISFGFFYNFIRDIKQALSYIDGIPFHKMLNPCKK